MEVIEKGSTRRVRLTKNEFVYEGGEGKIFVKGPKAYKIYLSAKRVIPFAKFQELEAIDNDNVIRPKKLLMNTRNQCIGYTMKAVPPNWTLCQIFPKGFRKRNGLNEEIMLKLIQQAQGTIADIHKAGVLIVDMSELNLLTDKQFQNVYFIDTDSYETKSFSATAITPSIRDYHSKKFSQLTDWYSFAIISFQMFVGMHPFKGKYTPIRYPKDKGRELEERMRANIPVFHKEVSYPAACLPFDTIPQAYKDWYKALFFEGKRVGPPSEAVECIIVPVELVAVQGDNLFEIKELQKFPTKVVEFVSIEGLNWTITQGAIFVNGKKMLDTNTKHIGVTPRSNLPICAGVDFSRDPNEGMVKMWDVVNDKEIPCNIAAEDIMSTNGRIYIKNVDKIREIQFVEMGNNIQAVFKTVATVMEKATSMFDGVAIQNILGAYYLSLFPSRGKHYQLKCEELDGYKIIDARYENQVLIVIAHQKGKYDKFIFKFDERFASYTIRKVEGISYSGINFTVLDNGIVVHINENEEVEIFSNDKDAAKVKVVESKVISSDMDLYHDGTNVRFAKADKLYSLRMK